MPKCETIRITDYKMNHGVNDILETILELAENIGKAYEDADINLIRVYLSIFFNKIYLEIKDNKNIILVDYKLSDKVEGLVKDGSVLVGSKMGRRCDVIRTHYDIKDILNQTKQLKGLLSSYIISFIIRQIIGRNLEMNSKSIWIS